jgi:peroxiredoxin
VTEQTAMGQVAPDFELTDVQGKTARLSDYRGEKHVLLVFTRGFI